MPHGYVEGKELKTRVLRAARVDIQRAAVGHLCGDEVLCIEIEDVEAISETAVEEPLAHGELIVPEAFGGEVGVGGTEHVKLAQGGIAETFAHDGLQLHVVGQACGESALRYPLAAAGSRLR